MLYIDGISLSKIKEELLTSLKGKKVNKVTQNGDLSLTVHFGRTELFFSCTSSLPICYIKEESESADGETTNLILNLRKYLQNAMLLDIEQIGLDRILVFKFSKLSELGEIKIYGIIFEMMGKHSNFFLVNRDGEIVELLKRFSLEENKLRPLFPGMRYEQPVVEEKLNPKELSSERFQELKDRHELYRKVEGIGKLLAENLDSYEDLETVLESPLSPKIYFLEKRIVLGTVLDIEPQRFDEVKSFETYQRFINFYIDHTQLSASFQNLKSRLISRVNREIKKNDKTLKSIEREKEEKKDFERFKEIGDILAASLYSLKRGMDRTSLYDFYRDEIVEIELDPLLSPERNLERYYRRYNKMKKGLEISATRALKMKEDLEYLEGIKSFLERAHSYEELKGIEEELIGEGYIKRPKSKGKPKKVLKELKYGVVEDEGLRILYGRNNLENDNLTFKVASREDYWFHAKDIPGSHVILRMDREPTEEEIEKAAHVAAENSKANRGDRVKVDYVKRKHINKPKGAKPGFVIYTGEKSIVLVK